MKFGDKVIWDKIAPVHRKKLVWILWFITWLGLVAGYFYRLFYEYVVYFTAVHTLLILFITGFQVKLFPVQVRIAYLIWVAVGTYVPHMVILMYITTIGLATNLFLDYCPLARMLYLFRWNRSEPFSLNLVKRVFLSPPVKGQFKPRPL